MLLFTPPLIAESLRKNGAIYGCWMMIRTSAACRCIRTSSSVFKLNQTCFVESSLGVRHGFLITTGKPSARDVSGSLRRRRGRRKQDSQNQKWKSCWSRSSMSEASSTVSSCHRARRSISKSTKRSCGFCFAQCARKDESCGRINRGCFTTTMHLLTTGSSWPRRTSPYWNNLTWPCSVWLFSFPQAQGDHQGDPFWRRGGHQKGRNDGTEGHPRRILPAVHRSVAEKDGKVH